MLHFAPPGWDCTLPNPFTPDGAYGPRWSAFLYDDSIPYLTNVTPGARLHAVRVNPAADPQNRRFYDFIRYETAHGREVILRSCPGADAQSLAARLDAQPPMSAPRPEDPPCWVHSTTAAAWSSIRADGALVCPSLLRARQPVDELGLAPMLEPADYSDYVMLDVPNGCGELVVNSRSLGRVCTDPDARYTPGVRLYFDAQALAAEGLITRDGLHLCKVLHRLPLSPDLAAVITPADFPADTPWTPSLFTRLANERFFSAHGIR